MNNSLSIQANDDKSFCENILNQEYEIDLLNHKSRKMSILISTVEQSIKAIKEALDIMASCKPKKNSRKCGCKYSSLEADRVHDLSYAMKDLAQLIESYKKEVDGFGGLEEQLRSLMFIRDAKIKEWLSKEIFRCTRLAETAIDTKEKEVQTKWLDTLNSLHNEAGSPGLLSRARYFRHIC